MHCGMFSSIPGPPDEKPFAYHLSPLTYLPTPIVTNMCPDILFPERQNPSLPPQSRTLLEKDIYVVIFNNAKGIH